MNIRARTRAVVIAVVGIVILAVGATSAAAGKPDRAPYNPDPIALAPGQACAFEVSIGPEPGSNFTESVFPDGRYVITGSGADRVTRVGSSASVVLPTSGRSMFSELPSGDMRIEVSGRSIIYLYAGDQGPFGEVGDDGALYYIVGRVDQVLSTDDVITSFVAHGRITELCSRID